MRAGIVAVACAVFLVAAAARSEPVTARAALELAAIAADAWADDARLVWVENDAPVDSTGQAAAWAYLYYSREKHAMRSWSVRDGRIVTALDHTVSAEAPALDAGWRDTGDVALQAVRARGDAATTATLQSLVLVRGVFAPGSAWVAVFDDGPGPRLHVLLDAMTGDLIKRWRG